jgi:hypothetical protein
MEEAVKKDQWTNWTSLHHDLYKAFGKAMDDWIANADDHRSRETVYVEAAVSVVRPMIEELQRQLFSEQIKVARLEEQLNQRSTKASSLPLSPNPW